MNGAGSIPFQCSSLVIASAVLVATIADAIPILSTKRVHRSNPLTRTRRSSLISLVLHGTRPPRWACSIRLFDHLLPVHSHICNRIQGKRQDEVASQLVAFKHTNRIAIPKSYGSVLPQPLMPSHVLKASLPGPLADPQKPSIFRDLNAGLGAFQVNPSV